ncbi:unnamed protein product [Protopolystoma xenopodis]|uniref:Uncharacterized protein n=1 Tax=Protopolystoma xenopodis TaxID=117903 RepID=A0A3S5AFW6_9PLAT|nr:unnamed protein product [Protopolystoma xenopodis]
MLGIVPVNWFRDRDDAAIPKTRFKLHLGEIIPKPMRIATPFNRHTLRLSPEAQCSRALVGLQAGRFLEGRYNRP